MQDVEVSVLIELLAVVTWHDKCGVIKNETDFSTLVFITCSIVCNKTVLRNKKRN